MFTGLVETIGTVFELQRGDKSVRIGIEPQLSPFEVRLGDSVSVDGVCLTVEQVQGGRIVFCAVYETLNRSTLAALRSGQRVNLERSLQVNGRVDGHFVLGHVDAVGHIVGDRRVGESLVRTIGVPAPLIPLLATKGSVAIDGISLTIADSRQDSFDVSLIPYSIQHTTMAHKAVGAQVNIECDVLARYITHFLKSSGGGDNSRPQNSGGLYTTLERLGF
jgi:riboflavin synthase